MAVTIALNSYPDQYKRMPFTIDGLDAETVYVVSIRLPSGNVDNREVTSNVDGRAYSEVVPNERGAHVIEVRPLTEFNGSTPPTSTVALQHIDAYTEHVYHLEGLPPGQETISKLFCPDGFVKLVELTADENGDVDYTFTYPVSGKYHGENRPASHFRGTTTPAASTSFVTKAA